MNDYNACLKNLHTVFKIHKTSVSLVLKGNAICKKYATRGDAMKYRKIISIQI